MLPREQCELATLLEKMSISDLTVAKQLLSKELDRRSGRTKKPQYVPTWPPDLMTR
jgi:hypothetical protein